MNGTLYPYCDQGNEGISWAFTNNDQNVVGWDKLNIIETGDHLTIYGKDDGVLWEGVVEFSADIRKERYPFSDKEYYWQRVRNCTVHGLPVGINPDDWFQWFVDELSSSLVKKQNVHID